MMMMALITNKKNPNVKKVIGIVNIVNIGLTTAFKNASTTATNKALVNPSILMPGRNLAVIMTATAEINMLAKNFIPLK